MCLSKFSSVRSSGLFGGVSNKYSHIAEKLEKLMQMLEM